MMRTFETIALCVIILLLAGCATKTEINEPRLEETQTLNPKAPELTWEPIKLASHYEVEVSIDPDFARQPGTYEYKTDKSSLPLGTEIQYSRTYFWRVRSVHWNGAKSIWSNVGHFMLPLKSPEALAPSGKVGEQKPAFTWLKVPGASRYEVEISADDKTFGLPELSYATEARDYFPRPFACEAGRIYYWRVRSITPAGTVSNWSQPVEFSVAAAFAEEVIRPADGEITATLTPAFKWEAFPAALRYQIEVFYAEDAGKPEARPVFRQIVDRDKPQLDSPVALEPDREYSWRVRAVTTEGPGDWSKFYKFRTPAQ
jgi:hypothetical protein